MSRLDIRYQADSDQLITVVAQIQLEASSREIAQITVFGTINSKWTDCKLYLLLKNIYLRVATVHQ